MILASSGRVWPHYAIFMHLQSLQKFSPPSIDITYAGMLCVISPILCKEKANRQPGNRIPIFVVAKLANLPSPILLFVKEESIMARARPCYVVIQR